MKKIILAAIAISVLLTACSPAKSLPVNTPPSAPTNTPESLPTASVTSLPTMTSSPVPTDTASPTATPDYSTIKFTSIYYEGTTATVFVFALNGAQGNFHGQGNDYPYECRPLTEQPDKLYCFGPYQAPGRFMEFKLYVAALIDPVLTVDTTMPSPYPPTPVGMRCEIEPLWMGLGGETGCYAVTCYVGDSVYGSTQDTCEKPWIWPVP